MDTNDLSMTDDLGAINPMIAAALARHEDATGLCTVRECTELLHHSGEREIDLCFNMEERAYLVRVQILQITTKAA